MKSKKTSNYKPVILPPAKKDIKEAARWYEGRKVGLGKQFTQTVRKKIQFICQNPYAVAIRYEETRTAVLETFPYMIHFSIEENSKLIVISAVLSTHQDPNLWSQR